MLCQLKQINKSFDGKKLFDHFSIEIKENDFICITGKSGTGKTTLLNMIGLLEKPDSGQIDLYGYPNVKPNTRICRKILREHIGFLFQNFALISNRSIDYNLNIALVNKRADKNRKNELLKELHIESPLSEAIFKLSGGEQQRIALARILLKNSDLILADEPTGSLDAENRDMIMSLLAREHSKGKTIVIVSHDPKVANICERQIEL